MSKNVGINSIKDMYQDDEEFRYGYRVYAKQSKNYHTKFVEYLLQEGLLFKGIQLCIPKGSLRENIIKSEALWKHGNTFWSG